MGGLQLVVWAVVPPFVLLIYYARRIPRLNIAQLSVAFVIGALSGLIALGLAWGFEYLASAVVDWRKITYFFSGVVVRQFFVVAPIEEGCKLAGVILCQRWLRRRRSGFGLTVAIALGFTAEENWVYLSNGTAGILERLIATPVHLMFSAPWGYQLLARRRVTRKVGASWLNAVMCHALVNVLAISGRYPPPLRFLSYGLFPFLLWMFWRLEQIVRLHRQPPITLISGRTLFSRFWQFCLAAFAFSLGGNAIFNFLLLARSLRFLPLSQVLSADVVWFLSSRLLVNLIFGLMAWIIYRYLRRLAMRRG